MNWRMSAACGIARRTPFWRAWCSSLRRRGDRGESPTNAALNLFGKILELKYCQARVQAVDSANRVAAGYRP
jgi:hypothetical protein